MITIQLAIENDCKLIADLATKIWNQHYVPIIGQQQVDYMLNEMYTKDSLLQQMNEKQHQFYLVYQNQSCLGFLSISTQNKEDYFLHKFYINQEQASKGIGTQALNTIIESINPKTLTLTVNRQNYKSINFYFKNGFIIDRVEDFDIGHNYVMNDFVMVRNLDELKKTERR